MAQEDLQGDVPPFATPDDTSGRGPDPDLPNQSVLLAVIKLLDREIDKNNGLDYVEPAADGIMSVQAQIAVRKEVLVNLRNCKVMIENKLKEYK